MSTATSSRKATTAAMHDQRPWWLRTQSILVVGIPVLLFLIPFVASPYRLFQLTGVLTYAVAALGLVLITGSVGVVSLSHNAFYALGAYVGALTMIHWHVGFFPSVVLAGLVCFAVGLIAGYPARRLSGIYLVLVTIALATAVTPLIRYLKEWTGGTAGLLFDQPEPPEGLAVSSDAWIYWMVLLASLVVFYLVRNLTRGSFGRSLAAVREVPLAASSLGINVDLYKVLTIAAGSALAGIGGALFNFVIGFIAPESFSLMLSISFLAAVVIGGMRTIYGAIVAGLFLQFVPSFAADVSEALAGAIYGGILILAMLLLPTGVGGQIQEWFSKRRDATSGPA